MQRAFMMLSALCLSASLYAAETAVDVLLAEYQAAGAKDFNAAAGQSMWEQTFIVKDQERSCTTCHGTNLQEAGKHAGTGKLIKPLAPSVNPQRLTDIKEIKKWLLRNCKWTLERECTAQEKGDFLVFLRNQ